MKVNQGYTILEVLIFIAVSALIFVAAMTAIGGRQAQVQFSQSTREVESKITDIMNDVTTGYFPTNETVSCTVSVENIVTIEASTGQNLGTSDECIYVGKVMQFLPDGDGQKIRIYTLAGRRFKDDDITPIQTLAEAGAKAVAALPGGEGLRSTVQEYDLLYGLKVSKVIRPTATPIEFGAVAIVSNFGGASISGSQTVQVGGIVGSRAGMTEAEMVDTINSITDSGDEEAAGYFEKNTAQGIVICLESNQGKRSSVSFGKKGSIGSQLNIDDYNEGCDE